MKKMYGLVMFFLISQIAMGQSFEILGHQEVVRGVMGETLKNPIRIKNLTDRPLYIIIRKLDQQLGSTQKALFCVDQSCSENRVKDFVLRIDPLSVSESIQIMLEAGLAPVTSSLRYAVINKNLPSESTELDFSFSVEEKSAKDDLYSSRLVRLHNVYPNPVIDVANVEYKILVPTVKAKIVLHNILGTQMEEYTLPTSETHIKIRVEALATGIYFYTLYIDNEGVVTRKLIVRK